MEDIKNIPPLERPREKLQRYGASKLSDEEILAILLGSGTPQLPLGQLCTQLLQRYELKELAEMDLVDLCRIKGIGPAKATVLLAAAEYCKRLSHGTYLITAQECYDYVQPILAPAVQLQYILLLLTIDHQLLVFAEVGCVLPDIAQLTTLATEAGAQRLLLARNGWPAFSNAETQFLQQLQAACQALHLICEGVMAVGPDRFKMI